MANSIENLLFYLVSCADLVVIVLILLLIGRMRHIGTFKLIAFYCLFNSLCNLTPIILKGHNLDYWILVIFTIVEYLIFAYLFFSIIVHRSFKQFIKIASSAFLIFIIFTSFQQTDKIDSFAIGVESILIFIYSFYFLYEQMNLIDNTFIYSRFHFWIVIGSLIYFGGSFFIYIFANNIDYRILAEYWFITYIVYIIKNIFYLVAVRIDSSRIKTTEYSRLKASIN